jgi:hypothetical protein
MPYMFRPYMAKTCEAYLYRRNLKPFGLVPVYDSSNSFTATDAKMYNCPCA